MTRFVLGFCFSPDGRNVVLINKLREYLVGLNGVGGRIEPEIDFEPIDAMRREFREETGLSIHEWRLFALLTLPSGVELHCFEARSVDWHRVQTVTDEEIECFAVQNLSLAPIRCRLLPFCSWLIPLALDARFTARLTLSKP